MFWIPLLALTVTWALYLVLGPSVRVVWRHRRELATWWHVGPPR